MLSSAVISLSSLGWFPVAATTYIEGHFDSYYTGLAGNLFMFVIGYLLAAVLPARPRDLTNLTVWTQDATLLD